MAKKAPQPALPATTSKAPPEKPDHETIAVRAYQLWVSRGCPIGSPEVDWECAERELLSQEDAIEKAQAQTQTASFSAS